MQRGTSLRGTSGGRELQRGGSWRGSSDQRVSARRQLARVLHCPLFHSKPGRMCPARGVFKE